MTTAPLLSRSPEAPIAWLSSAIDCLGVGPGIVSTAEFIDHVRLLSEQLPDTAYTINLCDNRYLFLLGLCASITRGQTTLLPANKNVAAQEQLQQRYRNVYILHDGAVDIGNLPELNIQLCGLTNSGDLTNREAPSRVIGNGSPKQPLKIPQIPLEHAAAICFTSGSTGEAKANTKTWRTMIESTAINCRYMLPNQDETFYHLATVPAQHMWGLETSVLLVLFSKVCMVDIRPSFPIDIRDSLASLPSPRALITTPLHLRALLTSNAALPELANILSATAPLSQSLAAEAESQWNTQVREIYGCSEVGSMAVRRTAKTQIWKQFDTLEFTQSENQRVKVSAPYLPSATQLEDTLEMLDEGTFRLQGRVTDQVKVAGKRGSLNEVNKVLFSFKGIIDGVVFFPEQDRAVPRLVAIAVIQEGFDKQQLREHFRLNLDSVFVPRPIFLVKTLPREENGKLTKSRLLQFYRKQLTSEEAIVRKK